MGVTLDQLDDTEKEIERLKERVASICREHVNGEQTLLLSALGKMLEYDLIRLKLVSKVNLTEFLRKYLPPEFKVAAVGPHRNIFSVVAADQNLESYTTDRRAKNVGENREKGTRFHQRFWAAFAVPLSNQADRRFLDVKGIYFRDTQEEPLSHEIEIERTLIPPADMLNRDSQIKVNIAKWVAEHGLDDNDFLVKPRLNIDGSVRIEANEAVRFAHTSPSVLDLIIGTLDHRQLQAISLPLDAVAALLRKKAF